jgi:hypothetical protein
MIAKRTLMALKLKLRQRKVSGQSRQRVRDIIGRLGVDAKRNTYLSITGRARVIRDTPIAKAV